MSIAERLVTLALIPLWLATTVGWAQWVTLHAATGGLK